MEAEYSKLQVYSIWNISKTWIKSHNFYFFRTFPLRWFSIDWREIQISWAGLSFHHLQFSNFCFQKENLTRSLICNHLLQEVYALSTTLQVIYVMVSHNFWYSYKREKYSLSDYFTEEQLITLNNCTLTY